MQREKLIKSIKRSHGRLTGSDSKGYILRAIWGLSSSNANRRDHDALGRPARPEGKVASIGAENPADLGGGGEDPRQVRLGSLAP